MDLDEVVSRLETLAPPSLAESWDNVGLLAVSSVPSAVRSLLLTVDLTEGVLREAMKIPAQMILAYHPPIFRPLLRLGGSTWKERVLTGALENRVAIYSPHTALDAIPGGVNDWLAGCLGEGSRKPLSQSSWDTGRQRVDIPLPGGFDLKPMIARLLELQGVSIMSGSSSPGTRLSLSCHRSGVLEALRVINDYEEVRSSVEIVGLVKAPLPGTGMGRFCRLTNVSPLSEVVQMVKEHLGLKHVRLALGTGRSLDSSVKTAAVCAGSGGSILDGVEADLYLTALCPSSH
ncbi:NIF3-like protein 1 isoform X2 [Narcine bancroftii]|uniref:NIF3-like protein 1 isoform X2 n=1 Tax=Narcine bancroftii TaxID=1343680 RepID=UPI003831B6E8